MTDKTWRVSKSGFSIKTGWGDDKKLIAKYPGSITNINEDEFKEWLDNAELICDLVNNFSLDNDL